MWSRAHVFSLSHAHGSVRALPREPCGAGRGGAEAGGRTYQYRSRVTEHFGSAQRPPPMSRLHRHRGGVAPVGRLKRILYALHLQHGVRSQRRSAGSSGVLRLTMFSSVQFSSVGPHVELADAEGVVRLAHLQGRHLFQQAFLRAQNARKSVSCFVEAAGPST